MITVKSVVELVYEYDELSDDETQEYLTDKENNFEKTKQNIREMAKFFLKANKVKVLELKVEED